MLCFDKGKCFVDLKRLLKNRHEYDDMKMYLEIHQEYILVLRCISFRNTVVIFLLVRDALLET